MSTTGETTTPFAPEAGEGSPAMSSEAAAASEAAASDVASGDAGSASGDAQLDAPASDSSLESDSTNPLGVDGGPPPRPQCDPMHVWKPFGIIPSVPQAGFGRFGGISVAETAIAWTSPTGGIYVADRPQRSQAFSAMPSTIDTTSTPVANDRVALGSTGMELFAVSADRKGFVAFYRTGVGAAWSPSAAPQFSNIDAMASADSGGQFSEPVLGADGNSFFYLLAALGGLPTLFESKWSAAQHAWTTGTALPNPELAPASATGRRRPTGVSADGRTLFFYDEVATQERAAWRDSSTSPFVTFVDTPGVEEAAPNYRCDVLYFQEAGSDSGTSGRAAIAQ
jgi:hypothetical protein